jgi:hypothetical protein
MILFICAGSRMKLKTTRIVLLAKNTTYIKKSPWLLNYENHQIAKKVGFTGPTFY